MSLTREQVESVSVLLKDVTKPMGARFRALFTLKNVGGVTAIGHIGQVLLEDKSALLKHECAYCLGQMRDEYAIEVLAMVLANVGEHPMVRHEAGEALGAIATEKCLEILKVRFFISFFKQFTQLLSRNMRMTPAKMLPKLFSSQSIESTI